MGQGRSREGVGETARAAASQGLAACATCGFEARGAIRKVGREGPACEPCAAQAKGSPDREGGWVSVWAPETSQAAIVALVRTAHVVAHLHAEGRLPDAGDMSGADFGWPAPESPLVEGARRVIAAVSVGRAAALRMVEERIDRRAKVSPGTAAAARRRMAAGVRRVPCSPGPEEIEGWIEGGGTYAGWTAETLAGQVA